MADKVVALRPDSFPTPSDAQKEIVELLEYLLEDAKKGEIAGLAIGVVRANHMISTHSTNGSAEYSALVASASMLHFDLCACWGSKDG